MEKYIINYSDYSHLIDEFSLKIKDNIDITSIKFIYTFARGGLPIAVHLSHFLNKPMYTDESKIDFSKYYCNEVLVVDDIADTGKTLKYFKIFKIATLFYKPRCIIKPDVYVVETTKWVCFPWEQKSEIPNRPI